MLRTHDEGVEVTPFPPRKHVHPEKIVAHACGATFSLSSSTVQEVSMLIGISASPGEAMARQRSIYLAAHRSRVIGLQPFIWEDWKMVG